MRAGWLTALVLPEDWTTANTFQIQVLLALPLPLYGAVDYYKRKDEVRDRYVVLTYCV